MWHYDYNNFYHSVNILLFWDKCVFTGFLFSYEEKKRKKKKWWHKESPLHLKTKRLDLPWKDVSLSWRIGECHLSAVELSTSSERDGNLWVVFFWFRGVFSRNFFKDVWKNHREQCRPDNRILRIYYYTKIQKFWLHYLRKKIYVFKEFFAIFSNMMPCLKWQKENW